MGYQSPFSVSDDRNNTVVLYLLASTQQAQHSLTYLMCIQLTKHSGKVYCVNSIFPDSYF